VVLSLCGGSNGNHSLKNEHAAGGPDGKVGATAQAVAPTIALQERQNGHDAHLDTAFARDRRAGGERGGLYQ
jgi:hypothetical protein